MKVVGGFRRTRFRGLARTRLAGYFVAAAYNLVRMARLIAAQPIAVIRYRSRTEVFMRGIQAPLKGAWHTDTYEKRDGRWQAVWSHATGIR